MRLFESLETPFFSIENEERREATQAKYDRIANLIRDLKEDGASDKELENLYFALGYWLNSLN